MSRNFALDTNIVIYAFTGDSRNEAALALLEAGPKISLQLLNEFASVSVRKRQIEWPEIVGSIAIIRKLASTVRPLTLSVHERAIAIVLKYKLSFYDSLMLAAALLDQCDVFYSEDMHHGLVIDDRLTILNPFLPAAETL